MLFSGLTSPYNSHHNSPQIPQWSQVGFPYAAGGLPTGDSNFTNPSYDLTNFLSPLSTNALLENFGHPENGEHVPGNNFPQGF